MSSYSSSDPVIHQILFSPQALKPGAFIDVRAPVEFKAGSVPGAVNLPLMNDRERHEVGLCYKSQGQAAAIELGHQLVSGVVKEARILAWLNHLQQYPDAQIFCFRGGLRSQISCQWINERGWNKQPIPGGYKRLRSYLLGMMNSAPFPALTRLGGMTGSGKTELIQAHLRDGNSGLDLEALAGHRGSAFGEQGEQPAQASFENRIAIEVFRQRGRLLVEDESPTIGKRVIPIRFYRAMKDSPWIQLTVPFHERVDRILRDYVLTSSVPQLQSSLVKLKGALGGLRTQNLLELVGQERNREWIEILLREYYDPLYLKAMKGKQPVFEGSTQEIRAWLASQS